MSKWLRDRNLIQELQEETEKPNKFKCKYHGTQDEVHAFSKEAFEFGAKSQLSRVNDDGTADIQISYEGVYPCDLFDQIASKYHLNLGRGT